MNPRSVSAFVVLCLVSVSALPAAVSAEERAILSGGSFSVEVQLDSMEFFTYSWSSDEPLSFSISGPSGLSMVSETDKTSGSGTMPVVLAGEYVLTWSNEGASTAHVSFDLSEPFGEVEETVQTFIMILGIIATVLIVVVVLIVVIVLRDNKRKEQAPPPPAPMAAKALETGHCPSCGFPVAKDGAFCANCGTRFR